MNSIRIIFTVLAAAMSARAQLAIDNGPEIIVSGQFDSGSIPDIAVVDKQSGQVRTGVDVGNGLIWSGPLLSGLAEVTSAASGRLGLPLNEGIFLTSRTGNAAARVAPTDASSPPVVYPRAAPSAAVALDFTANSPASNTNGLWLSSSAVSPSAFPEEVNLVTVSSAALSATSGAQGLNSVSSQGQRVRFTATGNLLAAFAAPAAGRVFVYQSFATGIPALPYRPQLTGDFSGLPPGVQFAHEYILPGGQAMFLFWSAQSTRVYHAPGAAGNTVVSSFVEAGGPVAFVIPLNVAGAQGFIVFPPDASAAKFYAWNGAAFTLRQSLTPPAGKRWTGALPGTNMKLLHGPSAGGGTGGWQNWALQGNGQFSYSGLSGSLPARVIASPAHVFAFTQEPFVSPLTVMTDARRVTDWTSGALALPGTRVMNVSRETYSGSAAGLGSPVAFNAGTAPVGSAWMLANQYAPDISVAALSPAKIVLNAPEVDINPAPRHLTVTSLTPPVADTLTFTASAGAFVYYRLSAAQAFMLYSAASPPVINVTALPQSTTVEYYAIAGSLQSRLHQGTFTYGPNTPLSVPAGTDSDGDGLSDAWEAWYGQTDPNADPDNDGLNNLTEQNSGSDPLGPCQPGELPELSLTFSAGSIRAVFTRGLVPGEQFQSSGDLSTWQTITLPAAATEYTVPAGTVRRFFRIRKP